MPKVGYLIYRVVIKIIGQIEGGVPKDPSVMKTWLETKGISSADVYRDTLNAMGESANVEVLQEAAIQKSWCGFKQGPKGLYIEARQIKAALKEAANVLKDLLGIRNARSRLAERVWVRGTEPGSPEAVWLGVEKPDDFKDSVVHAMTRMGPVNSFKRTDFVTAPQIEFDVEVLNDKMFTLDVLKDILNYMGRNGLGANRSQGAGKFKLVSITKVADNPGAEKEEAA